jgi:hypothetical protein
MRKHIDNHAPRSSSTFTPHSVFETLLVKLVVGQPPNSNQRAGLCLYTTRYTESRVLFLVAYDSTLQGCAVLCHFRDVREKMLTTCSRRKVRDVNRREVLSVSPFGKLQHRIQQVGEVVALFRYGDNVIVMIWPLVGMPLQ